MRWFLGRNGQEYLEACVKTHRAGACALHSYGAGCEWRLFFNAAIVDDLSNSYLGGTIAHVSGSALQSIQVGGAGKQPDGVTMMSPELAHDTQGIGR